MAFTVSVIALGLPACVQAQDSPPDTVIVTVTREALPVSTLGQKVDVLTDKDIKAYQSLYIDDLLTHTTDLSVTRNGGPGESASASLRGAGADHTLYVLDGLRLNDPSQVGGGTNLGLLATGDASRIEVLRGPLSTLWGSGALGGVISITTRMAQAPLEGNLTVEGLDHYGSANLGLGGKLDKLNWRLFANTINDDGVSAFDGGVEKDGFAQTNLGGNFSYNISDNTTIKALMTGTHSRNAYDGYPPPTYSFADTGDFGKTDTTLASLGFDNRFTSGEQSFSLGATDNKRIDFDPDGMPNFVARGRITSADYHLSYHMGDNTRLLGGISYERDTMSVSYPSSYDPNPVPLTVSSNLSSVYGQIAHDFTGGLSLAASVRHDDASSFGGSDVAQASLSLPVGAFRFHASAGQGFKAPSLYQLYSDYGQSGLQPEKAQTLDGGVDYTTAGGLLSLTAFSRQVRDLIDFGYDGCSAAQLYGCYGNIDRSKASGIELEGKQDLGEHWRVTANYSWLTTRNESPGLEGLELPHTPRQLGSVDLAWTPDAKLSLGLGVRSVGKSFDDAFNSTVLSAYSLVDLRASYALTDGLTVFGRVENAGDTHYETAGGYGQLGRRVWLGLRARLF